MSGIAISADLIKNVNKFGDLIKEWNKFSLVANSTLDDLWGWHFNEAFSIVNLLELNHDLKIYDFGAGGGVIGFPLALYGFDICLVERSENKLFFLKNILKYSNIVKKNDDYLNSLVIVRGVDRLLLLLRDLKSVKKLILFKSSFVKDEINEALNFWSFKFELYNRVGNARGFIVYIYEIFKK